MNAAGGIADGDRRVPAALSLAWKKAGSAGHLFYGVTEARLKLISDDEARALMVLLGLLNDTVQSEEIRRAAGEMRFRIDSRLA
ncbi:hypothetical protein [Streptomyces flavotricini]|uniref:hypothetical protein n=1 Tax=Streptomyces flavotricini TaxID=66888 RepID=UPI001E602CFA|nr:hypothetical protein [Streptomyces flavotricini]